MATKTPIFIAHRSAWMPGRRENSVAAIERASTSGRFAYLEVDVRRTRSNDQIHQTPILMHDETLDRLYELNRIPKSKRLRAGQSVYGLTIDIIRSEAVEVATLHEAMRAAKGHPLNLEIKSSHAVQPTLDTIADIINKYDEWSWEKVVISSKNWQILYDVRQKAPQIGIAMLYSYHHIFRSFGKPYHELGARWLGYNKWLTPICVPLALLFNVKMLYAYTVNNAALARALSFIGVTGVFTDSITLPDQFKQQ